MSNSGSIINVRGQKKRYGANQAVAGIDLTIEGGEIFAKYYSRPMDVAGKPGYLFQYQLSIGMTSND